MHTGKKRIAIIGDGYIGRAHEALLGERYGVSVFGLGAKPPAVSFDLAVICVPTPSNEDGSCDTSAVEEWLECLEIPLILIKSTVPPGSTQAWRDKYKKRIVFSPEFIGESGYYTSARYLHPTDITAHPFMVLAGPDEDTREIQQIFLPILGPEKQFIFVEHIAEAEMMKYIDNTWGAMKVTMWNEFFEMCGALDLNFHRVRELVLLDPRVERIHTAVFENNRGFGGKCFPKDTKALAALLKSKGYIPELLQATILKNEQLRQ